jgi:hypothetical protein
MTLEITEDLIARQALEAQAIIRALLAGFARNRPLDTKRGGLT